MGIVSLSTPLAPSEPKRTQQKKRLSSGITGLLLFVINEYLLLRCGPSSKCTPLKPGERYGSRLCFLRSQSERGSVLKTGRCEGEKMAARRVCVYLSLQLECFHTPTEHGNNANSVYAKSSYFIPPPPLGARHWMLMWTSWGGGEEKNTKYDADMHQNNIS